MTHKDEELEEFKDELAWMLVRLGPMPRAQAKALVMERAAYNPDSDMARMSLLHETPYYWAMSYLHGGEEPPWFKQPGNWPPPPLWKEYDADKQSGAWVSIFDE